MLLLLLVLAPKGIDSVHQSLGTDNTRLLWASKWNCCSGISSFGPVRRGANRKEVRVKRQPGSYLPLIQPVAGVIACRREITKASRLHHTAVQNQNRIFNPN